MTVAFGLAVAVAGWQMPRFAEQDAHFYTAPGFLPFLLGVALILFGTGLALRRPAASVVAEPVGALDKGGNRRFLLTLLLGLIYAAGLLGRLPFWLATSIFIAAFILIFEWKSPGPRWRSAAWAIGIALVFGFGVRALFEDLFLVRLP